MDRGWKAKGKKKIKTQKWERQTKTKKATSPQNFLPRMFLNYDVFYSICEGDYHI